MYTVKALIINKIKNIFLERCYDNMIENNQDDIIYIKNLEMEKRGLENKIRELNKEINFIDKLIFRRKSQQMADSYGEKKSLKNSDRLFYEVIIIDLIKESKNGLRTSSIFEKLKLKGYFINYNTFRSYITRMRDAGKIKKSNSYNWVTLEQLNKK